MRIIEEIKKSNGAAGPGTKEGLAGWEELLKRVFGDDRYMDISNSMFYYPKGAQLYQEEYEMLLKLYSKLDKILEAKDKILTVDYMDMLHNMPNDYRRGFGVFDRKRFLFYLNKGFPKKHKDFFSRQEVDEMKKWCKRKAWKIYYYKSLDA